jgi:hypothetical protein
MKDVTLIEANPEACTTGYSLGGASARFFAFKVATVLIEF